MDRTPIGFIKDVGLLSGIISHDSATFIHNLSTFPEAPVVRFCEYPPKRQPRRYRFVKPHDPSRLYEETIHLGGDLYVTSPKRTIVDMVAARGTEEFIYQSIETYLDEYGSAEDLLEYADTYGVRPQMQEFLDTLDGWDSY